jgi:hypothetical protein
MMKNTLKVTVFLLGILTLNMNWGQSNALNFDGIKDYVQWGDPNQGSPGPYAITPIVQPLVGSDFTIELEMKSDNIALWPGAPGDHGVLWAFNMYHASNASNRLIFGINTLGQLYIHDGTNTGLSFLRWTGPTIVTDGECHQISFTHNFSTKLCSIYIDGNLEGTYAGATFILGVTDVFNVGQEWDDLNGLHPIEPHLPSQFYYGDIDDIRIWTEERAIGDIVDNRYTNFSPTEPNLLADFKIDHGIAGGSNPFELLLVNNTISPSLDGDIEGFDRSGVTSNFVEDKCAPCYAATDSNYIHIDTDTTYTSNTVWDNKYYIAGGVTVTVAGTALLDITNVDVVFGPCAEIIVEEQAYVRINNSVLRPCNIDETWKGITFRGGTPAANFDNMINESTFKNAENALYFTNGADGVVSNNLFSNCKYGIRVDNNNAFNHAISGNRFVYESFYPEYITCDETPVDNSSAYGIYSFNTTFEQHISHNEFINSNGSSLPMVTGVSQFQGASTCSNNTFTDLLHAVVINSNRGYTNIANNRVEVNYPSSSTIFTNNISIYINAANGPLVEINNNQLINSENQILAHAAIGTQNASNISIAGNEIEGFDLGIIALSTSNSQITENEISNCSSFGIFFEKLEGPFPTQNFITCNTISMKDFNGTTGIHVDQFTSHDEISSNCILDCATSMVVNGGGTLPLIRNNYLYNYTTVGIDVLGHTGNIGVAPLDPGMNTLYSNDNLAVDVQSLPWNITIADNFGMFNISWATVTITSGNPYHSTASCGHQIFASPSQGNLNPDYHCDHKTNVGTGVVENGDRFALAPDYLEQLFQAENKFNFIRLVIGTFDDLNESELEAMIETTELSANDVYRLKYHFYFSKSNLEVAKIFLNTFTPENEVESNFKRLNVLTIDVIENGFITVTEDDKEFLSRLIENNSVHGNYAVHLLNNLDPYQDYIFEMPGAFASIKSEDVKRVQENQPYLNVYPNPTTSLINVELVSGTLGDEIQLISMTGQVIEEFTVNIVAGKTVLDLSEFDNGVYFIVLKNSDTGIIQKERIVKITQ